MQLSKQHADSGQDQKCLSLWPHSPLKSTRRLCLQNSYLLDGVYFTLETIEHENHINLNIWPVFAWFYALCSCYMIAWWDNCMNVMNEHAFHIPLNLLARWLIISRETKKIYDTQIFFNILYLFPGEAEGIFPVSVLVWAILRTKEQASCWYLSQRRLRHGVLQIHAVMEQLSNLVFNFQ